MNSDELYYTPAPTRIYENSALIVDDNLNNRQYLTFLMSKFNIAVTEAEDCHQAMDAWNEGHFSHIFLDIEMPNLNGLEVARRIRAEDSGIALIVCSSIDDPVADASLIDCDMYLVKPLQVNILMTFLTDIDCETMRKRPTMVIYDNAGTRYEEPRRSHKVTKPFQTMINSSLDLSL